MNRRDVVVGPTLVGVLAFSSLAQQTERIWRIALVPDLGGMGPGVLKAFTDALGAFGRREGRDYVLIRSGLEYGPPHDILAKRAIEANPDLIVSGGTPSARPIQRSAPTLPVVLWGGGFPIQAGIVESLAHPGKSVTGITVYADSAILGKYLQLLREAKPGIKRVGVIWSNFPPVLLTEEVQHALGQYRTAARQLGLEARIIETPEPQDVDLAIVKLTADPVDALIFPAGRALFVRIKKLLEFSAQYHIPVLSEVRWSGSDPSPLLSYGPTFHSLVQQAAGYVNRILWGGAKPGDLAMQQPTMFELVVNLRTAKALGLKIPQSLLLRADEVIQ